MKTSPQPVRSQSPRSRVIGCIREWIEAREWHPGERVPAENDLADRIGVSRTTVRAALAELEEQGMITKSRGRGRVVAGVAQAPSRRLAHALVLWTHGDHTIVPDLYTGDVHSVDSGVVDQARRLGLDLLLVHWDGRNTERIEAILEDHPRGVLATGNVVHTPVAQAVMQRFVGRGVPLLVNCSWLVPELYDRQMFDHETGCYELTRWLLAHGRKRILRFYTHNMPWMADRDRGYEKAMREAGLEPLPPVGTRIPEEIRKDPRNLEYRARFFAGHLVELLRDKVPVDAVLVAADNDVLPMHMACRTCGVEPHRDIAIAGYDNHWAHCWRQQGAQMPPTITIDKQNHWAGQLMVDIILSRTGAATAVNPQTWWVAPKLVECAKMDR